jgi:2-polyprenyl-6-methoxyphenol hydroxylase-like FAD-dependent oxidoreductase
VLTEVDVLVAGGGPAGSATAAALAQLGLRTLIADAGQDRRKQLAGELLHPAGVQDLVALGFSEVMQDAAPVVGFATTDGTHTALLPYAEGERGIGLEHHALVEPLFRVLAGRSGIDHRPRTRVTEVENGPRVVEATLVHQGRSERVRAQLLVAADGRASPLRRALGIQEEHERLSTMVGVLVDAALLPHPGRGHLFVGGPSPVLAYAISAEQARVMVDLPLGSTAERLRTEPANLSGLPEALRQAVLEALQREPPLIASNDTRLPDTVVRGRAVLVGDAAGCCHPLSASGLSSAVRDARTLRDALGAHPQDLSRALGSYARARRPPNRTRIALASALYRAFSSQGTEMAALRSGLFRYWERTRDGARFSMALLSTRESRMSVMAREYVRVVRHGLIALGQGQVPGVRGAGPTLKAGSLLIASAVPHLRLAVAGAVEDRVPGWPGHVPAAGEPLEPSRASASRS